MKDERYHVFWESISYDGNDAGDLIFGHAEFRNQVSVKAWIKERPTHKIVAVIYGVAVSF